MASSIMLIRYSFGPRSSSQACSLVSHCTSSPTRDRRCRHWWIFSTLCLLGAPQLAFDHPGPHRLASDMNVVLVGQILRRQRRTEAAIHLAAQDLQRRLLGLLVQLAVGSPAPQRMHDRLVALGFQLLQQPANMPLALADLFGRLPLRDQALLGFLQCDQPVAVPLRHEKCS